MMGGIQSFSHALTVRRALKDGAEFLSRSGVESARLDAELLLGKVLECGREGLYARPEGELKAGQEEQFQELLRRRAQGEPVAYISRKREFWSLDFLVTPDVLVPRPETELLVEMTLEKARAFGPASPFRTLELGTGSGAVAVSVARELRRAEIWATDVSLEALKVARVNAERHGVARRIQFLHGDLFAPVQELKGFFHMIISNPPYVPRDDIPRLPREVRDWEPRVALDGGADGLDFYRGVAREGHRYVVEGGFILLEIGAAMGEGIYRLFTHSDSYSEPSFYPDYRGVDRIIVLRKLS